MGSRARSYAPPGLCAMRLYYYPRLAPWAKFFRPSGAHSLQFLHLHVLELHARAVAEEADVAAGAGQARVLLEHLLVLHVVQVGVDDRVAVELHGDLAALGG